MKHALLILWIAALLGCAQATIGTDSAPLVFDYGAFDLSFQLTLRSNRTYTETEVGPLVALNANGERPPPAVREQGTYGVDGDRVVLYPGSGGRRILRRIDGAKTLLREEVRGGAHDYVEEPNRKAEEIVQLPPFVDTAYSQVFTVSRAQPMSGDRRYRLKSVRNDGSVELIDCAAAEIATKTIVVSPAHRVKRGERPQTIVVVAADADKQTATIRELRMK